MITFTKEKIPLLETTPGEYLEISVFRFKGKKPGPSVYIQSSVHAEEVQGNFVIFELMKRLSATKDLCGEVVLVPHCNPFGASLKLGEFVYGRYHPATGENWNRHYWNAISKEENGDPNQVNLSSLVSDLGKESPEQARKLFKEKLATATLSHLSALRSKGSTYAKIMNATLQSLAVRADIVLDLHCDTVSLPHVYTPEFLLEKARDLPVNYFVSFPNEFSGALDEACALPWWSLVEADSRFAELTPIEAYTVELGNMHTISSSLGNVQAEGILNFLESRGSFGAQGRTLDRNESQYVADVNDFQRVYSKSAGLIEFSAELGAHLKAGDTIGTILSVSAIESVADFEKAKLEISVPEDCLFMTHASSSITHQHESIAKVFRNYREL